MLGGAARVLALRTTLVLIAAYGVTGLTESPLVDVPATDTLSFVAAAAAVAILAPVGLNAALVPSVRAARMNPTEALRSE